MLTDNEFIRYQRQVALSEVGEQGQLKLKQAKVLIVGAGGLGNPVALYLASAGVGSIVIADGDEVEISNLQRQVAFSNQQVGVSKAQALVDTIKANNPLIHARAVRSMLQGNQLKLEVMMADLVLDCSDNFATRFEINQACVESSTALVSASAIGWKGQMAVFTNQPAKDQESLDASEPCYQCLVPVAPKQKNSCSTMGIVGPVVATLGTYQALAAIRYLLEIESSNSTNSVCLHLFDGLGMSWQKLHFEKNAACPVCGTHQKQHEQSSNPA
ncbi:HesA/MoeB/ThiF family protein [Vibrio sp. SCSIO 43136]|uniref:HesA/MoeB/ThiF family protein n=1 Tax=Vibrio sp. SCSIO 43136 TaxID=2819101 RepID=UPI0020752452|nr:HesA/MoeB/ThiF family protein [Vibrio sp. SCSIO 43136]USD65261.1 HesA/MoeB/ThiF family protein [Vibrio sp. SCSIO 43136]